MSRLPLVFLALIGCTGEPAEPTAKPVPADGEKKKSNVRKFVSPVPYGKHVACADLVDGAKFAAAIGGEVGEVKDRSSSNGEATSVCAFMRAGSPPSSNAQLKAYEQNAMKLGVLPGDEYCTVTAFCAYPADLEAFKAKCEADRNEASEALGQFACVRKSQRGPEFAYTYRVIDSDTQCIFEVMGGPSVTDEVLVQSCTKAALDTIASENIQKVY